MSALRAVKITNNLEYKNGNLDVSSLQIDHQRKISPSNMPPLKTNWKSIAENLKEKCKEWVKNISKR